MTQRQKWWYRGLLMIGAGGLSGVLWFVLRQPVPDALIGGFAALALGIVVVLFAVSFWPRG